MYVLHCTAQMEERRKLGLVRFSLAMDDMRRLVDQAGFAEHEDSDVDEEADSARQKALAANRSGRVRALNTFFMSFLFRFLHISITYGVIFIYFGMTFGIFDVKKCVLFVSPPHFFFETNRIIFIFLLSNSFLRLL